MTRHLLIIGAQRCGTTCLHNLLDGHPDITMARPSSPEPKVFVSDALAGRGLDWYKSTYFAHATTESVLGEKSTSYLEDEAAASRAAAVLGGAEIIVSLRDPIARAVSNWLFSTSNGLEGRSLTHALEENLAGSRHWDREATSVSPFAYLERGRYADYLEPWFAAFPRSVHVRFLEEIVGHPGALPELYATIGVDDRFRHSLGTGAVNQSTGAAPDLAPGLVERMRAYFHRSDERLRQRLGRDLPWPAC